MNLYSVSSVERFIAGYLEQGGMIIQMNEGSLGCGDVLLYDPSGRYKTCVIREIYLNEWSSAQTVRQYNRTPKKFQKIIDEHG